MALVRAFQGQAPRWGKEVFLAENASLIGDIVLGDRVNIWYGAVLRADVGKVRIGHSTNIQDLSCIHMTTAISDAIIGNEVTIGHCVVVHGAIIGDGVLIGMGSIIMDNAEIGEGSIIGAGSLVTAGTKIPPRSMAFGRPARVVRELRPDEIGGARATAEKYVGLAAEHRRNLLLPSV